MGRRTPPGPAPPHPAQPEKSVTPANHVALGFRAHSGWAAAVALAGSPRSPEVIDRRRIELVEPGAPGGVQPYHAARNLDSRKAEQFIAGVIEAADRAALRAIDALTEELSSKRKKVVSCGIVLASGRALPSLDATLKSHALVHTAEGSCIAAPLPMPRSVAVGKLSASRNASSANSPQSNFAFLPKN